MSPPSAPDPDPVLPLALMIVLIVAATVLGFVLIQRLAG